MVNDAKNLFLAGVGAAALTYEKATEVISQLVEKGKFTVEEGKELSEELKRNIKSTASNAKDAVVDTMENIKPLTRDELNSVLDNMNLATKADIIQLQRAIEKLEEKLN